MSNTNPTQCERVLDYMATNGSITALEAINDLGVLRLASRISNLKKDGYPIESEMVTVENRYGEKCRVKQYRLAEERSVYDG